MKSRSEVIPEVTGLGAALADMGPALVAKLRSLTPARVGLRSSGVSLATPEVLEFQLAHARARDAVHTELQPAALMAELRALPTSNGVLHLHSAAANRLVYLQRPDLGRQLDKASRSLLLQREGEGYDLAIVIADGLSALAVERHAVPLIAELFSVMAARSSELRLAPICVVEQGRVAVGDDVGLALAAAMVVVLIGERPGLSSADSLGAYITWLKRAASDRSPITDAGRNCISNIRAEGLSYADAAARLFFYISAARRAQLTGVALKDPEDETKLLSGGAS